MYDLCRNKIICFAVAISCIYSTKAQQILNLENHDSKPYYFGISLSYTQTRLRINKGEEFLKQSILQVIDPKPSNGIAFGLHATGRLSNYFEIRLNPQLLIGSSYTADYIIKDPMTNAVTKNVLKIPALVASFPLQLKFMSDRIRNFKVYAMGGVSYNLDLANDAVSANTDVIKTKKNFYGVELGVGCSFYLPFVIVSPEIKLSYMFNNILSSSKPPLSGNINAVYPYFNFFTIHFEG